MTDLRAAYDTIMELQHKLQAELIPVAAKTLLEYPHDHPEDADYRKVKALAATYELQEYLANAIAEDVAAGNLGPDPEDHASVAGED